jgi:hypothetical protein
LILVLGRAVGEIEVSGSVKESWLLGVTANRLTLLGIIATIALTVAFGINGVSWWCHVAIGVVTFLGVAVACQAAFSSRRVRHVVMGFAYWMLHEKPIEDKNQRS